MGAVRTHIRIGGSARLIHDLGPHATNSLGYMKAAREVEGRGDRRHRKVAGLGEDVA